VNALDESAVALLGRRYGGTVATRGLWQWSGGLAETIPFAEPPSHAWSELWALARNGSSVTPVALLRQVLFDEPGDGETLRLLAELAAESAADRKGAAERLVAELGKHEEPNVAGLLDEAAELRPLSSGIAFALMAPMLQARLDSDRRSMVRSRLDAIVDDEDATTHDLAAAMLDALELTNASV